MRFILKLGTCIFRCATEGNSIHTHTIRLARSTSPGHISPAHSPRSSATGGDKMSSDKKDDSTKSDEKKDEKPGAGNALLQVTEAHLATLSDEDGDT